MNARNIKTVARRAPQAVADLIAGVVPLLAALWDFVALAAVLMLVLTHLSEHDNSGWLSIAVGMLLLAAFGKYLYILFFNLLDMPDQARLLSSKRIKRELAEMNAVIFDGEDLPPVRPLWRRMLG